MAFEKILHLVSVRQSVRLYVRLSPGGFKIENGLKYLFKLCTIV